MFKRNKVITEGFISTIEEGLTFMLPKERNLDTYEKEVRQILKEHTLDHPIIEFGAAIGVVSCLAKVDIAVEANPYLIPYLVENRNTNKCKFKIINKALSYTTNGSVTLHIDRSFVASSLKRESSKTIIERVSVSTVNIQELATVPSTIILSVEGAEIDAIRHDDFSNVKTLLVGFRPRITGRWNIHRAMFSLWLKGFRIVRRINDTILYTR